MSENCIKNISNVYKYYSMLEGMSTLGERFVRKLGSEINSVSRNIANISSIKDYVNNPQNTQNTLSCIQALVESSNSSPHSRRNFESSPEFNHSQSSLTRYRMEETKGSLISNPKNTPKTGLINTRPPPQNPAGTNPAQMQLISKTPQKIEETKGSLISNPDNSPKTGLINIRASPQNSTGTNPAQVQLISKSPQKIEETKGSFISNPDNSPKTGLSNFRPSPQNSTGTNPAQVQLFSNSAIVSYSNELGLSNSLMSEHEKSLNPAYILPSRNQTIVQFTNLSTGTEYKYKILPMETKKAFISDIEITITNANHLFFIQSHSNSAYFNSNQFFIVNNSKFTLGKTQVTFSLNNKKRLLLTYAKSNGNPTSVTIKEELLFRFIDNGQFVSEGKIERSAGKIFREGEGWKIINLSSVPCLWKQILESKRENLEYPLPLLLKQDQLFLFKSDKYRVNLI